MFGATLRDHAARYDYAQEWLDIVKLTWSPREDFEFDGLSTPERKCINGPE